MYVAIIHCNIIPTATAAMSLQKACKFASLAPHSADLNAQLLQGLGGGEAVRLVRQLVDQEEVNSVSQVFTN